MDHSRSPNQRAARKRTEKGRRCWSGREEHVLLAGLREIVTGGWKSENGFRPGFLNVLEKHMGKAFPGTDLKATPHINSKIHTWKRCHSSLFDMLSKSGIGYNHTTKCIEATDEAWEAYVAVDGNAKGMRYKSWPYYEQWNEIFGKDRATGEGAETFVEALNQVLNDAQPNELDPLAGLDKLFDGNDDMDENVPISQGTSSTCGNTKSGRKRKATESGQIMCDLLGRFCETTDARLSEIAKRIGYDYDISTARKQIWAIVETFEGMTLKEKLTVSKLLVKNTDELELFGSLPVEAREEFARMKLNGNL